MTHIYTTDFAQKMIDAHIAGTTLVQLEHKGQLVWAAVCARNRPPHRYTLAGGVACADWGETLADLVHSITARS